MLNTATAIATVRVPNPLRERVPQLRVVRGELRYDEDSITPPRALRDDPLGLMHSRRQIGEAQYRAGREVQRVWEMAAIPLHSAGDIRERVSGGQIASDGLTDKRLMAAKKIARWRNLLAHDWHIIEWLLIDKLSVRQIAERGDMMPGKASTTFHGHLVRRLLTILARDMGLITR